MTGILGVALQKWVPIAMTRGLHVEAIYERIPQIVGQLVEKADRLVVERTDAV